MMGRRTGTRFVAALAVALGVLVAATGAAPVALAQEKISLRFSWKVGAEHVPFIVAKEKGYYAAEGLDVTLKEGMGLGSGGVLKLMGAGEETFGISQTATTLKGVIRGLPVVQVMTINSRGLNGILLKSDSTIRTPKDFIGKTIAGSGGGMIDILQAFLDINQIPVNQVKYVAAGTGRLESMVSGKADGALGNGFNDLLDVRNMGARDATIFLFSKWGVPESGAGVVANVETVKQKPELVRSFVRASLKGIAATVANADEAAAIAKKHFPMVDEALLLPRLKLLKDLQMLPDPLGWQDPKVVESLKEIAAKYDQLPQAREVAVEKIFTNGFLPKP